jgi:small subunit ribosomal protein S7
MAEDDEQVEDNGPVQEQPQVDQAPAGAPKGPTTEAPSEVPAEVPAEAPAETSASTSEEGPKEVPPEAPAEEPTQEPAEEPTQEPAQAPAEEPTQEPTQEPAEEPTQEPTQEPAEEPTQEPTQAPAEEPTQEPTQEPAEEPTQEPTQEPAEEPTQEPTQAPAEEPTQEPAKGPEEPPIEAQDEASTADEEAGADAEGKPKKKAAKRSKKVKAEAGPEVAEGEVLIETIDEKTDRKISYTIKPLFGKYPFTGVVVTNPGLQRYVNINPVSVPHTGARHANRPFAKQRVNIVERLINGMMRSEWGTGEKAKMYRVVEEAFDMIHDRTKQNPIQVFVDALSNSAPKEEVTRLRYGGINVPKAVDVSASRRLDIALRNICHGAIQSSHNNKKRLQQCLADEIILASKREINSFAVAKKEELERIAASAR